MDIRLTDKGCCQVDSDFRLTDKYLRLVDLDLRMVDYLRRVDTEIRDIKLVDMALIVLDIDLRLNFRWADNDQSQLDMELSLVDMDFR